MRVSAGPARVALTRRPGPGRVRGFDPGGRYGSGCRLGRWCLSVPRLRRNWEGVGSTAAPAPAVVPRAERGVGFRGGPGPQPVPGPFQAGTGAFSLPSWSRRLPLAPGAVTGQRSGPTGLSGASGAAVGGGAYWKPLLQRRTCGGRVALSPAPSSKERRCPTSPSSGEATDVSEQPPNRHAKRRWSPSRSPWSDWKTWATGSRPCAPATSPG
jgi:hypothetical protein